MCHAIWRKAKISKICILPKEKDRYMWLHRIWSLDLVNMLCNERWPYTDILSRSKANSKVVVAMYMCYDVVFARPSAMISSWWVLRPRNRILEQFVCTFSWPSDNKLCKLNLWNKCNGLGYLNEDTELLSNWEHHRRRKFAKEVFSSHCKFFITTYNMFITNTNLLLFFFNCSCYISRSICIWMIT